MTVPPSAPTHEGRSGNWSANGATVRAIRQARKLLQEDLAQRATKLSNGFLSRIETGKRNAGPSMTARIADALDVPIEVLTGQRPAIGILREAQGISRQQFAADIGITTIRLRRLEQGAELPNPALLQVIANRLGVDPAALRPNVDSEVAS